MPVTKVESSWSGGNLEFHQTTAANSAGVVFGGNGEDFFLTFSGTNFPATSTAVSGTSDGTHGYLKVKVGSSTRYIKLYDSAS